MAEAKTPSIDLQDTKLTFFSCVGVDRDYIFYRLRSIKEGYAKKLVANVKGHVDLNPEKYSAETVSAVIQILDAVCQENFVTPADCPVWGFKFVRCLATIDDMHGKFAQITFYFRNDVVFGCVLFLQKFAAALAAAKKLAFSQQRDDTVALKSISLFEKDNELPTGLSLRYSDHTNDSYFTASNDLIKLRNRLVRLAESKESKVQFIDMVSKALSALISQASKTSTPQDQFVAAEFSRCLEAIQKCDNDCSQIIKVLQNSEKVLLHQMNISRKKANAENIEKILSAELRIEPGSNIF